MNMKMDYSKNLLYTWFGNTHKFDYVHRLVISFYIFKVLATPNESTTGKALDILWYCIMNQTFKPKMRGVYLVTDEIRNAQMRFAKEYDLVLEEISRMYPELLIHIERKEVVASMSKEQMEKSTKRFIVHLNQFMISMKVAYKHVPEPESVSQNDNPAWIVTMLKVFKGRSNERLWFEFVMNEMKSLPDDKRNEEIDSINVSEARDGKVTGENVRDHDDNSDDDSKKLGTEEDLLENDDDTEENEAEAVVEDEAEEEEEEEEMVIKGDNEEDNTDEEDTDNEKEDHHVQEEEDDVEDGEEDDTDDEEEEDADDRKGKEDNEEHTLSSPEKENGCIKNYLMRNKKRKNRGGKLRKMKLSKQKVVALKEASNETNDSSTSGYKTDCSNEENEIERNDIGVFKSENCAWSFNNLQNTLCGQCDKDGKFGIGDMRFLLKMMGREDVQQVVIRK